MSIYIKVDGANGFTRSWDLGAAGYYFSVSRILIYNNEVLGLPGEADTPNL